MYDDDDIYGEDSGFQIIDGSGYDDFGDDAAAQWLASMEKSNAEQYMADVMMGGDDYTGRTDTVGDDVRVGMASAATLQEIRFSHMSQAVQSGIQQILLGERFGDYDLVELGAAREAFSEVIGEDSRAFAKRMKIEGGLIRTGHPADIATAYSMVRQTAGSYLDRGPGGQLVNTYGTGEQQEKADESLIKSLGTIQRLADLYIDKRTIGSPVEGARRKAVEEALTKWAIDGTTNKLPLPNELGVTGIVPTQGIYGTGGGTALTTLEAAGKFDKYYQVGEPNISGRREFLRDEQGYKIFKEGVTEKEKTLILSNTPSLKQSLFPIARGKDQYEDVVFAKINQANQYDEALASFKVAREVLREQMPTTRDESKGQKRMTGFDAPYGEQADLANIRNELSILGHEWNSAYSSTDGARAVAGSGLDADPLRSELTEMEVAVEQYLEEREVASRVILPATFDPEFPYPQGTPEWKRQRKGRITASVAGDLLSAKSSRKQAIRLAEERLGVGEEWLGNAHTREGNEGEAIALRAFLRGPGKGLRQEEAYFTTNPDYPGFGVSPDGLLYDAEGNSKGLLELKYLTSGAMDKALKKYTPQMQLQMAITGEDTTNFFALDKYTGEYVHHVVKADPAMQRKLITAGQDVLSTSEKLTFRDIENFKLGLGPDMGSTGGRVARQRSIIGIRGQQQPFAPEDPESPVLPFDAKAQAEGKIISAAQRMDEKRTRDAALLEARAYKEDASRAEADLLAIQNLGKLEVQAYAEDRARTEKAQAFAQSAGKLEAQAYAEDARRTAAAEKEKIAAIEDASRQLREFGSALQGAAMGLAGFVTGGTESAMKEVRVAAEAGLTTKQARGMRDALQLGGLTYEAASRVIGQAGTLQTSFNDQASAASEFTRLMEARGTSGLQEVRQLDMPSLAEFKSMTPQELTTTVASMMQGKSRQARTAIASMFNMPQLATYSEDPRRIMHEDAYVNESETRNTYEGVTTIEQVKRNALEEVGETAGFFGGAAASAVQGVGALVAGLGGAAAIGKIVTSRPQQFLALASQVGSKATNAAKALSTAARLSPVGAIATSAAGAISVGKAVAGIEEGGVVDSVTDVAEFALYGAAVGSFIPGVGTMLGAGVGAGLGVANEAWEYLSSADNAMPTTDIGPIHRQPQQDAQAQSKQVNVTVTNEISPHLITTTTDVDGDVTTDTDSSLSTGG